MAINVQFSTTTTTTTTDALTLSIHSHWSNRCQEKVETSHRCRSFASRDDAQQQQKIHAPNYLLRFSLEI